MRNRLLILAVILIILVGGSIAVIVLVNRSPKLQNVVYKIANTNASTTTTNTNQATNRSSTLTDQEAIQFTARTFTEMYGSFSNQNAGSNLLEAAAYATSEYAATLRQEAVVKQAQPASATYQQVITKALVFKMLSRSSTSASMVVTTQQRTTNGSVTTTANKDLLLDLQRQRTSWLVSAAVWK
jgi:Flp pilus assembly protein TadG